MDAGLITRRTRETKSDRVSRDLEIMARELGAGERLPSVRALCHKLEISLATLNTAMRGLEARGVIERRHGSGVYVTDRVLLKRIAVVVNSAFLMSGGSPVWGMILGEMMSRMPADQVEGGLFFAIAPQEGGLPIGLPTDLVYAIEQGRVDGAIVIGMHLDAVKELEAQSVPVVSFSGSGGWIIRINVLEMASQLAAVFAAEGKKTAMVSGCTGQEFLKMSVDAIEKSGLEVTGKYSGDWSGRGLVERMSHPFFHYGQDFATHFETIVQGPDRPDVLFLMDDVFANGFMMVWRNSEFRDCVQLACHSNQEMRLYRGWEGRLGLMEVEVSTLSQVLIDAAMVLMFDQAHDRIEATQILQAMHPEITMQSEPEGNNMVTTIRWSAHFLS